LSRCVGFRRPNLSRLHHKRRDSLPVKQVEIDTRVEVPETLYVEGAVWSNAQKDVTLQVSYAYEGVQHVDVIKLTVVKVNMTLAGLAEAQEIMPGGLISVNDDDDDKDAVIDYDDGYDKDGVPGNDDDENGLTAHFVDDWDRYHTQQGEVHCGTNAKRSVPSGVEWWN